MVSQIELRNRSRQGIINTQLRDRIIAQQQQQRDQENNNVINNAPRNIGQNRNELILDIVNKSLSNRKQRTDPRFFKLSKPEQNYAANLIEDAQSSAERSIGREAVSNFRRSIGPNAGFGSDVERALTNQAIQNASPNIPEYLKDREINIVTNRGLDINLNGNNDSNNQQDFQGPVQRFTDLGNFRRTGQQIQSPLVVSAANSPRNNLRYIGNQIKENFNRGNLPTILNTNLPNAVNTLTEAGTQRLRRLLINSGFASADSLFGELSDPNSKYSKTVSPIVERYGLDPGSLVLLFLTAPAFSSGAAAESEYIFDNVRRRFVKKNSIKNFQDILSSGVEEYKNKNTGVSIDIKEITRELIKRNLDNADNLKKLAKFYKGTGRETLFKDILAQEGIGPKPKALKVGLRVLGGPPANIPFSGVAVTSFSSSTGSYSGSGQYERTNEVSAFNGSRFSSVSPQAKLRIQLNNLVNQKRSELQSIGLSSLQLNKQLSQFKTAQLSNLRSKLNSLQRTGQATRQSFAQRTGQATRQAFRQSFKSEFGRSSNRSRPRLTLRPRIPFGVIPKLPSGLSKGKTKLFSSKSSSSGGYFALYKKGGKFFKINKKPLSLSNAEDIGAFVTDKSLARTFKIVKSQSAAQKSNLNIPKGYFKRSQTKFRPYKILRNNKIPLLNTYIERRKFSLDNETEVQKIQAAKIISMRTKKVFGGKRL